MVDKLEGIIGILLAVMAVISLWAVLTPNHAFVG